MPVKLVAVTIASIFGIMAGCILTLIGLIREIEPLVAIGIALAAVAVVLFLVMFIRTLIRLRREQKEQPAAAETGAEAAEQAEAGAQDREQ